MTMYSLSKNTAAYAIFAFALFGFAITASAQSYSDNYQNNTDDTWRAETSLTGSQEVPSVATTTVRGESTVRFDQNGENMTSSLSVLNGIDITAAHLHCGDVGENGPALVTLFDNSNGVNVNGSLTNTSIANGSIADVSCTTQIGYDINTVSELAQAIRNGDIYVNVHSKEHPNGVIRGQLSAQSEGNTDDGNENGGHESHGDMTDHRNDGYWKKDGNWHEGMDGRTDNGSWGDDNCWHEEDDSSDDSGDHRDWKDDSNNDSDWDSHTWNRDDNQEEAYNHHDSEWNADENDSDTAGNGRNGDDGYDGKDGRDGDNGTNRSDRGDSRSWRSGSSSSVSSVINAVNSVRVSVR